MSNFREVDNLTCKYEHKSFFSFFDVWLTVHLSIILANDQTDAQIFNLLKSTSHVMQQPV
jgi:hypothetical protein